MVTLFQVGSVALYQLPVCIFNNGIIMDAHSRKDIGIIQVNSKL